MASLNNGRPISQSSKVVRHSSESVVISDYVTNTVLTTKSNLGSGINSPYPAVGLVFGSSSGTFTNGMTYARREADNSVNRQLFTENGAASGYLAWHYTRAIDGIQTSVAKVRVDGSLGGARSYTERKVFFLDTDRTKASGFADWTIFNAAGEPVGAAAGTTDTDVTPSGFGGV